MNVALLLVLVTSPIMLLAAAVVVYAVLRRRRTTSRDRADVDAVDPHTAYRRAEGGSSWMRGGGGSL